MNISQDAPSDVNKLIAEITRQKNAEILEHKRIFAEKFPGTVSPEELVEDPTQYPILSYRYDYWAAFYVRVECYVTYGTPEKPGVVRQFHGQGGGVGIGAGIFAGSNPGTWFYVDSNQLLGDCQFWLQPIAIGAYIHFWRGNTTIGGLAGAGAGLGISFGGSGTWSAV